MIPIYSYILIQCTCDICQVYDYAQKYDGFVDRLLRHLNTSAMMDLLLQMVVAPDTNQTRLDLAQVHICDVPITRINDECFTTLSGLMIKQW